MPIYEFYSPETNKIYSFFARSISQSEKVPRCPDQPNARMERVMSRFAVTGQTKENTDSVSETTDPRMERVMAEMEREMSGMDEKNPDPRALARMMRKMTEASGQAVPSEMDEMIRRLEAGEDPEKLEEEFEGAMDAMDLPEDSSAETPGVIAKAKPRHPTRDPILYELSDYLE